MKLVSLNHRSEVRTGLLIDENEALIPSLAATEVPAAGDLPLSIKEILNDDGGLLRVAHVLDAARHLNASSRRELRKRGALLTLEAANFAPVIPDPTHLLNCGAMYHQHLKEMGGVPVPAYPVSFLSSVASLTGHQHAIQLPVQQRDQVDYEGEFAVIIGRHCYNVSKEDALDYVAGYTIVNDVSARDYVPEVMSASDTMDAINAWSRNANGKQHPTFSPIGPYLVTRDEIPDPNNLDLSTRLNGELMQQVNTSDLIFTIREIVAYFSQWYAFHPGDVIATGSPGGVGVARTPPVFLKDGDQIEVSVTGLGTLSNSVRGESVA